jgi:hypothetical protein
MSVGGRLQKQSKAPGCRDKGFEWVTAVRYHLLVYTVVCPYEFVSYIPYRGTLIRFGSVPERGRLGEVL